MMVEWHYRIYYLIFNLWLISVINSNFIVSVNAWLFVDLSFVIFNVKDAIISIFNGSAVLTFVFVIPFLIYQCFLFLKSSFFNFKSSQFLFIFFCYFLLNLFSLFKLNFWILTLSFEVSRTLFNYDSVFLVSTKLDYIDFTNLFYFMVFYLNLIFMLIGLSFLIPLEMYFLLKQKSSLNFYWLLFFLFYIIWDFLTFIMIVFYFVFEFIFFLNWMSSRYVLKVSFYFEKRY